MEKGSEGSDNKSKRSQEQAGMSTDDRRQAPEKSPSQMLSPESAEAAPEIAKEMYVSEDIGKFEPAEPINTNQTDHATPTFVMSPDASRISPASSPLRPNTASPARSNRSAAPKRGTSKGSDLRTSPTAATAGDYPIPRAQQSRACQNRRELRERRRKKRPYRTTR